MLRYFYFVAVFILILFSCKEKNNAPYVSNIKVDAAIQRYDKDFFDTTKPAAEKLEFLKQKYGVIHDNYMNNAGLASQLETGLKPELVVNKHIADLKMIYDTAMLYYKSSEDLEKEFKSALQYYKHYFPNSVTPKIFTCVEPLYYNDQSTFTGVEYQNDSLVVSLNMFLGKDFSLYNPTYYYDYIRERFNKNYIVRNSMLQLLKTKYATEQTDEAVVYQMIEQGKRIYVLDKLLPKLEDHIKVGYTKTQYEDCIKQEKTIWTFFINNNYLFSQDPQNNRDFNNESPTTRELGTDSPGNIGAFVGWQIVKAYMKKNEKIPLETLLKTEAKTIYNAANYKP